MWSGARCRTAPTEVASRRVTVGLSGFNLLLEGRALLLKRGGQFGLAASGITQCDLRLIDVTLERLTRGANVGELGQEIGFPAGQELDLGPRRLMVASRRVTVGLSGFNLLFEGRAL